MSVMTRESHDTRIIFAEKDASSTAFGLRVERAGDLAVLFPRGLLHRQAWDEMMAAAVEVTILFATDVVISFREVTELPAASILRLIVLRDKIVKGTDQFIYVCDLSKRARIELEAMELLGYLGHVDSLDALLRSRGLTEETLEEVEISTHPAVTLDTPTMDLYVQEELKDRLADEDEEDRGIRDIAPAALLQNKAMPPPITPPSPPSQETAPTQPAATGQMTSDAVPQEVLDKFKIEPQDKLHALSILSAAIDKAGSDPGVSDTEDYVADHLESEEKPQPGGDTRIILKAAEEKPFQLDVRRAGHVAVLLPEGTLNRDAWDKMMAGAVEVLLGFATEVVISFQRVTELPAAAIHRLIVLRDKMARGGGHFIHVCDLSKTARYELTSMDLLDFVGHIGDLDAFLAERKIHFDELTPVTTQSTKPVTMRTPTMQLFRKDEPKRPSTADDADRFRSTRISAALEAVDEAKQKARQAAKEAATEEKPEEAPAPKRVEAVDETKLEPCPSCGRRISKDDVSCPHCSYNRVLGIRLRQVSALSSAIEEVRAELDETNIKTPRAKRRKRVAARVEKGKKLHRRMLVAVALVVLGFVGHMLYVLHRTINPPSLSWLQREYQVKPVTEDPESLHPFHTGESITLTLSLDEIMEQSFWFKQDMTDSADGLTVFAEDVRPPYVPTKAPIGWPNCESVKQKAAELAKAGGTWTIERFASGIVPDTIVLWRQAPELQLRGSLRGAIMDFGGGQSSAEKIIATERQRAKDEASEYELKIQQLMRKHARIEDPITREDAQEQIERPKDRMIHLEGLLTFITMREFAFEGGPGSYAEAVREGADYVRYPELDVEKESESAYRTERYFFAPVILIRSIKPVLVEPKKEQTEIIIRSPWRPTPADEIPEERIDL